MSNQSSEVDYDKKFQEDLEKATALSLETLALDQFRRSKLQYSHSDVSSSTTTNRWVNTYRYLQQQQQKYQEQQQQRSRPGSFRFESNKQHQNDIQIPPPTSRRHSEIHFPSDRARQIVDIIDNNTNNNNSNSANNTDNDGDLISFTSPTSGKKEQNVDFDNLLEEIQKYDCDLNIFMFLFNLITFFI